MANNRQVYKRSVEAPVTMTESDRKNADALALTSKIVRYALIAVVLLALIFNMLSLVTVKVEDEQLDAIAAGLDKHANLTAFDLFGGWFAKSTISYADRGLNKGYQFPHVFDYIVNRIPALEKAASGIGASTIFGAITEEQDALLDMAYVAMLIVEIVSLVWLIGMAILFVCSFIEKLRPTDTIVNIFVIVHFVLTMVMFAFTLALASNSQENFAFSVGIGMWLNLLVSVVMLSFTIANMVCAAKAKANRLAL